MNNFRRFYALPCFVMRADGHRMVIHSNSRFGAEIAARRAFEKKFGYLPDKVDMMAVGA